MTNSTVINEKLNQFTLVADEERVINFTFLIAKKDYKVFDLTGATEITARFIDKNSSFIEVTLSGGEITVTNATGGQIDIELSTTVTAQLNTGDNQSFEVVVVKPTETRIAQVIGRFSVKPRLSC